MNTLNLEQKIPDNKRIYDWKQEFLQYFEGFDQEVEDEAVRLNRGKHICSYCGDEWTGDFKIGKNKMCVSCREKMVCSGREAVNIVNNCFGNINLFYDIQLDYKVKVIAKRYFFKRRSGKARILFQNNGEVQLIKKRRISKLIIMKYLPQQVVVAQVVYLLINQWLIHQELDWNQSAQEGLAFWVMLNFLWISGYRKFAQRYEDSIKNENKEQSVRENYQLWRDKLDSPLAERRISLSEVLDEYDAEK